MPTFRHTPDLADALLHAVEADLAADYAARSDERAHVSEVIYCLRKAWRKRKIAATMAAAGITASPAEPNLTLLMGQAWDGLMARAAGPNHEPHKRMGTDLISGEADAVATVSINGAPTPVVFEFKTTAAGNKEPAPLKWPHWVEQLASYLTLGEYGNDGVLVVLYLTMPKVIKSWLLSFTDDELAGWKTELNRRAKIVLGDEEPSTREAGPADGKTGFSWECGYCPFFVNNNGDCEGSTGRTQRAFSTTPVEFKF